MIARLLAVLAIVILPYAATAQERSAMTNPVDDRTKAVFADLEKVWKSRDFAPMRGFWAKDLPAPLYLPEEKKDFITTWAQFDAYFAAAAKGSKAGLVTYKPLFTLPAGPGQQMVTFDLEWTLQLVGEEAPIGGSVRGFALMREEAGTWKFVSYIEAPLAPIIYMRELYKLVAKDRGFVSPP